MTKSNTEKIKSLFYIVIILALSFIIPILFYRLVDEGIYRYMTATVPGSLENKLQAYEMWYSSYDWLLLAVEFLVTLLMTGFLLKFLLKISSDTLRCWFSRRNLSQFFVGLLLGFIAISIVFGILVLTGNAHVLSWKPYFSIDMLKYLLVFLLVGFSEELLYRGFIITALTTFKNKGFIMISSSLIFSLAHLFNNEFNLFAFLNITLIGIVFAYMFIQSGSLWMAIGYHITWNYFQGIVYGFNVSGITVPGIFTTEYKTHTLLNGGAFGPEAGLAATLTTLLILALIICYFKVYVLSLNVFGASR